MTRRRQLRLEAQAGRIINEGLTLHEAGDLNGAQNAYRWALKFHQGSAPLHDGLAHYNLGVALEDLGRVVEALEQYKRALAIDPDHKDARFNHDRLALEPWQPPAVTAEILFAPPPLTPAEKRARRKNRAARREKQRVARAAEEGDGRRAVEENSAALAARVAAAAEMPRPVHLEPLRYVRSESGRWVPNNDRLTDEQNELRPLCLCEEVRRKEAEACPVDSHFPFWRAVLTPIGPGGGGP